MNAQVMLASALPQAAATLRASPYIFGKLYIGALVSVGLEETAVQWLIVARDGTDEEAPARRMAVRAAHLANAARLQGKGHLLVGGALLDDDGRMIGSACVAQFATREELDAWLRTDPYVTGKVWQDIQILPYRVAPHYEFPPCPEAEPDASRAPR